MTDRMFEAPDSELGQLADAMLKLRPEDSEIRVIVMMHKGDQGLTALGGYHDSEDEDDLPAVVDMFQYLQRLMEANGRTMLIMPTMGPSGPS